jgi:hypothetical protein
MKRILALLPLITLTLSLQAMEQIGAAFRLIAGNTQKKEQRKVFRPVLLAQDSNNAPIARKKLPAVELFDGNPVINWQKLGISSLDGLDRIESIKKITGLNLSGNELTTLPAILGILENVETISLEGNKIISGSTINLSACEKLSGLILVGNKLTVLKEGWLIAPSLQYLYLDNNEELAVLEPGCFDGIPNLKLLSLGNTKVSASDANLKNIPEVIGIDDVPNQLSSNAFFSYMVDTSLNKASF